MSIDDLRRAIDVDGCRRYVLSRQVEQGGFCYYAYRPWGVEEPNAPDTHAAVAALRLLKQPTPEAVRCIAWLQTQQEADGGYSTLVIGYAAIKALQVLGAEPLRDPREFLRMLADLRRLADPAEQELSAWLASALRCIELWQDYGMPVDGRLRNDIAAALSRRWQQDGGFGGSETNLLDTSLAVTLAAALDLPVGAKTLEYARRCEGEPLGITLTPASGSSSLDVHLAGTKVLRYFGAAPRYPARIRQYVASCQTSLGGFGRAPRAIAELAETRRALEVLSALEQTGAGPKRRAESHP